jgi:hypothetical protein
MRCKRETDLDLFFGLELILIASASCSCLEISARTRSDFSLKSPSARLKENEGEVLKDLKIDE